MVAGRSKWHDKTPKLSRRLMPAAIEIRIRGRSQVAATEAGLEASRASGISRAERKAPCGSRSRRDGGARFLTRASHGARLRPENHTLKRSLADPRLFSGIGECVHGQRFCTGAQPFFTDADVAAHGDERPRVARLHDVVTRSILRESGSNGCVRRRARRISGESHGAFRPEMAVHGRFLAAVPGVWDTGA